jgi:hypothetical protein
MVNLSSSNVNFVVGRWFQANKIDAWRLDTSESYRCKGYLKKGLKLNKCSLLIKQEFLFWTDRNRFGGLRFHAQWWIQREDWSEAFLWKRKNLDKILSKQLMYKTTRRRPVPLPPTSCFNSFLTERTKKYSVFFPVKLLFTV